MSVYKRKGSPHWWINISVAGRKTRRTSGTADRQKAIEYEQAERDRLWRVHKLGDRSAIRFIEAAAEWLESIPEKSRPKELSVVGRLKEEIGEESIGSIDRAAVIEIRNLLKADGKANATVDRHLAILRAILRKAVENGHLPSAPPVPMHNDEGGDMRWLTHAEFRRLKRELPLHLKGCAEFAVRTGLRMRSMLRLTWDRVDLDRKRLRVPGSQMKGKDAHGLPIAPPVATLLRQLRLLNPKGVHVFQYKGRPIDDCNTEAFKKAVARSGLTPLRWHDLRHTFASWAVSEGVTLQELMQLGGWKSYAMVLRYAHLAPDHLAQAAAKVAHSGHSAPRGTRGQKRKKA